MTTADASVPRRLAWAAPFLVLAVAGCAPYLHSVDDGTYAALVPTTQQWADERSAEIPGGYAALSADGVERIEVRIEQDTVTVELDGRTAATRVVTERRNLRDSEGSGPFRAETQALALGTEPLVLGSLLIVDPVVWYAGGYDSTEVIVIKAWDADERGPITQCTAADEHCLALPAGEALVGDPRGDYTGVDAPVADAGPVRSIRVTATEVVYELARGRAVSAGREQELLVRACALRETAVWPVPTEVGVPFDDPVLVATACPLPWGEAPTLTVMERSSLPALAPLAPHWGGEWCQPGPGCLRFLDEEGGQG